MSKFIELCQEAVAMHKLSEELEQGYAVTVSVRIAGFDEIDIEENETIKNIIKGAVSQAKISAHNQLVDYVSARIVEIRREIDELTE